MRGGRGREIGVALPRYGGDARTMGGERRNGAYLSESYGGRDPGRDVRKTGKSEVG